MMSYLTSVGFGAPVLLWGLLALPLVWWLLRLTPPRPERVVFPPIRLLLGLKNREETPAHSPWWLTALRILLAALVIVALAEPVLHPAAQRANLTGPLVLVVDNGWAAADDWTARRAVLRDEIDWAQRSGVAVVVAPTSDTTATPAGLLRESPADALRRAERLEPVPHAPDRMALIARLRAALDGVQKAHIVWLADGLRYAGDSGFASALEGLARDTQLRIYRPGDGGPLALSAPSHADTGLEVEIMRAQKGGNQQGTVVARALNGRILGETQYTMLPDERIITAKLAMPLELRNEVSRVEIDNIRSAGTVQLLDERWRRKRVGLLAGQAVNTAQPLLSPLFYIERALAPYVELTTDRSPTLPEGVGNLIDANVGAIVLSDVGTLIDETRDALDEWIQSGGILIRFAGPRLVGANSDLIPVKLRGGARALGGTLSWSEPQKLAEFSQSGAFGTLAVPDDVTVTRQVLAEPDVDLANRTWARLEDGTPLVTAARRGDGWVVLFHVTANPVWSSLPLSGVFVEMLRSLVDLAGTTGAPGETAGDASSFGETASLPPVTTIDAFGHLGAPAATATPIAVDAFNKTRAGPSHPPGFYGYDTALRALNVLERGAVLQPLGTMPADAAAGSYSRLKPAPLRPWLLAAVALLLILDALAVLAINGIGRKIRSATTGVAVVGAVILSSLSGHPAMAQDLTPEEQFALRATETTRLAYVRTGNPELDEVTRAGLIGLSMVLARRTALEPGEPMGVNVARDELAFFPLLYWAVDPTLQAPSSETLARIDAYMRQGGTILFDTRDEVLSTGSNGPGIAALQRILSQLDIPALEPVPADHVLTKAFYLLQDFPGRYDGGMLWTEASLRRAGEPERPARNSDGVSSILITSNDLAAAWAIDTGGRPLLPVVPGGDRQREMAYRVGINLVMYALTGNYKADQVHIPALLERLGQ